MLTNLESNETRGKTCVALKRAGCEWWLDNFLSTESVKGTSLSLQSVDHIHGGDGLSLGVLGVGDGISDHILQKHLQDSSGLFVDQAGDTFHTTSSRQTTDGWLRDALDVVTENLSVTLGASLSQSFSSLASAGHDAFLSNANKRMNDAPALAGFIYRARRRLSKALHSQLSDDFRIFTPIKA